MSFDFSLPSAPPITLLSRVLLATASALTTLAHQADARAIRRQRRRIEPLSPHLRADVGLPPLAESPRYWDHQ